MYVLRQAYFLIHHIRSIWILCELNLVLSLNKVINVAFHVIEALVSLVVFPEIGVKVRITNLSSHLGFRKRKLVILTLRERRLVLLHGVHIVGCV